MIFILRGGTTEHKNNVVNAIAQLADTPVLRRSVMNVPLLLLRKSSHPHSQYISEIFHSYIGDVLTISKSSGTDSKVGSDGLASLMPSLGKEGTEKKKDTVSQITETVRQIANSLSTGVDSLFLFSTTLKHIGNTSKRHYVFVDLQYKEELEQLNKNNNDARVVIKLVGGHADKLVPNIKELTLLEDKDLQEHTQVEIPENASLHNITAALVEGKVFLENIPEEEQEKEKCMGNDGPVPQHPDVQHFEAVTEDERVTEEVPEEVPEMDFEVVTEEVRDDAIAGGD